MGFIVDAIGSILGHKHSNNDLNNALIGYQAQPAAIDAGYQTAQNTISGQYSPFAQTGSLGLSGVNSFAPGSNLQGVLNSDPVYNARIAAGTDAIDRSSASRLMSQSGGTLKALDRYGQQVGSDELNNIFSRYNTMANYGLDAASANSSAALARAQANAQAREFAAQGIAQTYGVKATNDNQFAGGLTQTLSQGLFGGGNPFASLFPSGNTASPALNGNVFSSGFPGASAINTAGMGTGADALAAPIFF